MTPRPITIGIVGSGGYGRSARAYLRHTGEFNIVACLDIDAGTAEQAAAEEHAQAYTEFEAFLAHPGMEAVSINTPVPLHETHAIQCLQAARHVFMTKPVAHDVPAAQRVMEAARASGLACMIGHHARHQSTVRLLREQLDSGVLGRVCNVVVTSCSSGGLAQEPGAWRTDGARNPGGPMLQCGIHWLDTLLGLFGPVTTVSSIMQDDITPGSVVDNTLSLLRFESGVQATFVSNYTTAYLHTVDILGTQASLHLHEHITGLGQHEVYLQRRAQGDHEPWEALRIPHQKNYPDDHGGVLERTFAEQIRTGRPDYGNLRDAIDALRIVDAAVRSHREGKHIAL